MRPEGRAILGNWSGDSGKLTTEELRDWNDDSIKGLRFDVGSSGIGATVEIVVPPLEGAGDWSHWEHSPDNNPVSEDTIIKAPYMTQFMAKPYYIAIPSITTAAGGRTFLAIGHIAHHRREWDNVNRLIARNGYNGAILWERDLPEGYLVHRSAFIATADTFYMIERDHALMLDPETGETQGQLTIPGVIGNWKWMVINDDVLYMLAGKVDETCDGLSGCDQPAADLECLETHAIQAACVPPEDGGLAGAAEYRRGLGQGQNVLSQNLRVCFAIADFPSGGNQRTKNGSLPRPCWNMDRKDCRCCLLRKTWTIICRHGLCMNDRGHATRVVMASSIWCVGWPGGLNPVD